MNTRLALFGVIAILGLAWGWDILQAPASSAHVLWLAREELLFLSGVLAIGLMSVAMYLSTRPAWLETPLGGMDRVYRTHKWAGIVGGSLAIAHWLIEMSDDLIKALIGRAGRPPKEKATGLLDSLQDLAEDFGEWGFYILLALLALTLWRRFPYRPWRFVHRAMPVIYLMLAFHTALLAPADYWTQPLGWLLGALLLAGIHGAVQALRGRIGQARRVEGEIVAVSQPASDVVAVRCRLGAQWAGHRPGQFALVSFDTREGHHPFTIASADQGDRTVEFRIKALGDYTRELGKRLQVGQAVMVEGPYGRFELDHIDPRARQLWVAGGIGVTPFLAWLAALQGRGAGVPSADLHYCTRDREHDPIVTELTALCAKLPGIRLHVHGRAQGQALQADTLMATVPAGQAAEVWFCGPGGLAASLRRGLDQLGLRRPRFHQEAFELR